MNPSAPNDRWHELANRLQKAWQTHRDDPHAVDLDAFLPPAGDPERVAALARLIPIDLAARWQGGVPVSLEDYIQRFPEIGPLDQVDPKLIADEYRIRAEYGVISPHSVLKQRFPRQFTVVEKLIRSDSSIDSAQTVMPAAQAALMLTKDVIVGDHYRFNRILGRGGFGEVWHSTDLRGNIDKAIKVLTRSADSEEAQKEFESLNIIKKINHPYLLRTESYFVEKDRLFIVMELADATMRDVLKKSQTESRTGIRVDDLLVNMKHAAEGLDFLHKQGILHRDIKPENILIVGDFGKVADFGLAKTALNKQSTQADFAGTVVYSAPETWDGRVTTRSDQYSLAATYFELRTGRILFSGKTFQEVFRKHMEGRPNLDPLPDIEQDVIRKALSKKPEDRYPTCAAFVSALENAVLASGSKVIASHPPLDPAPGTRKKPGKSTHENKHARTTGQADSLASRAHADLRLDEQTGPRKWNESSVRAPGGFKIWPFVAIALIAVAAGGAYFAVDFFKQPEPQTAKRPDEEPKPPIDVKPSVDPVVDPVKQPPIEPKPTPPVEPKIKPIEPKPIEPKPKPPEPPALSPARLKLNDARALFAATKFAQSRALLQEVNLSQETDAELKRDGLKLYADLLRDGDFSRADLNALDIAIADDPGVKPAFIQAMTKRLTTEWPAWPANDEVWKERLRDVERAESKSPLMQAIKAESLLETKRPVVKPLPGSANEPSFVTYVRANIAASERDYALAASLLTTLPADAYWLVDKRRARAALLLEAAALSLTPETQGRLRLFASVKDADQAFAWRTKALALVGKRTYTPAWDELLNAALAAAWKSEPDFAQCKALGDSLLGSANASKGVVDLALAHPVGFPKDLVKARPNLKLADVDAALALGDASPNKANPLIRARQARLWYTRARLLDRESAAADKILEADDKALELEPENDAFRIARARDVGLVALARASEEAAAKRIKICQQGLDETAVASQSQSTGAELWADLGRIRALLYLDVGRTSEGTSPAAKQAFQDAIAAAKQNLAGATPPQRADLAVVMAQAHEALAYLSQVDVDDNYRTAVRIFEEAAQREPRHGFLRGRCLYRWAHDPQLKDAKTKKGQLLASAVEEFEKLAKVADLSEATLAESAYWEGLANWDRTNRVTASPKAQKAFERSLEAAGKNPAEAGFWASYALQALVEMTRLQAKNSPEQSTNWLASVLPAWRKLATNDSLSANADFAAASAAYRDLLAETSNDTAAQYAKLKKFDKVQQNFDRALEMKHSTKHAAFAVNRALTLKKNQASIGLTPAELLALREQALAAVQQADPSLREALLKEIEVGWR